MQHRATPHHGLVVVEEEPDRHQPEIVRDRRHDHLVDDHRLLRHPEHVRDRVAVDVGVEDPDPCPIDARAAARLTESEDLPTPPLPEATASTRVLGESRIPFVSTPPRSFVVSAARSSGDITSNWSVTCDTSGSVPTCSATCCSKLERSGQPATVSAIVTETADPRS